MELRWRCSGSAFSLTFAHTQDDGSANADTYTYTHPNADANPRADTHTLY